MKKYIKETIGVNKRFHNETLLNYGLNRWGLNKASNIDKTSYLIRCCAPATLKEWEKYYFNHAIQNKKNGIKITKDYIIELGKYLYIKLSEVVHKELSSISEEECIEYVENLVINRTFEGYRTEIKTIYEQLEKRLNINIQSATDELDRKYNVDFYIEIKENVYIGLQIKPITGKSINDYQWIQIHQENHKKFKEKFYGKVFFIFSKTANNIKEIVNLDIIEEISKEIQKLRNEHQS